MECKFYMHKVFLLLRYRFVKCWRFVKSWRIVKGWRLRLYFFLVSFSQGHFSHVLPKRWEWWTWWTLKRDKRYGQDAAVCSHLAGFGWFFFSWEMQRYGNILAEGWGPGLSSLSLRIRGERAVVLVPGCCCCCRENSLPWWSSALYCFSYHGWSFACKNSHWTGTCSTLALTGKHPHHLLGCLRGKPGTPTPSPALREPLGAGVGARLLLSATASGFSCYT